MAGRGAGGVLRWGDEERRLVFAYLNDGRIDSNRVGSAAYLRSVKVREAIWDRHANKNFYQNVRRQVTTWLAGQERAGGRRGGDEDDEAEEADEDEDLDEEQDEPPLPAPPQQPRRPRELSSLCAFSYLPYFLFWNSPSCFLFLYYYRATCSTGRSSTTTTTARQSLAALLRGLRIGESPPRPDNFNEDEMLIYHHYTWYEAILPAEEHARGNIRLKRLTIDLLLPGPTSLDQIWAVVSSDG